MLVGDGFEQGVLEAFEEGGVLFVQGQGDQAESGGRFEVFFAVGSHENSLDFLGDKFAEPFPIGGPFEEK